MKLYFSALCLILLTSVSQAESRVIAISCEAIITTDKITKTLHGFKYSLHTGVKKENLKSVDLKSLSQGLLKIKSWGSVIEIGIFSKHTVNSTILKKIITAIELNPNLDLVFLQNGTTDKWGTHIKKSYQL
jgi:hypothetical protein